MFYWIKKFIFFKKDWIVSDEWNRLDSMLTEHQCCETDEIYFGRLWGKHCVWNMEDRLVLWAVDKQPSHLLGEEEGVKEICQNNNEKLNKWRLENV
jgi:hypothetical protein